MNPSIKSGNQMAWEVSSYGSLLCMFFMVSNRGLDRKLPVLVTHHAFFVVKKMGYS